MGRKMRWKMICILDAWKRSSRLHIAWCSSAQPFFKTRRSPWRRFNSREPIETIPEISKKGELKHPNMVWLMYASMNYDILNLIYEFFPIDLKKYIHNLPHGQLLETQLVKNYLNQITWGISLIYASLC